jgi:inner membrane protein
MSPITHFLFGWVAFERLFPFRRDKAIVALAGIAPDLDGLGMAVDLLNRALQRPETTYYNDYHRLLAHGLPAAVGFAALAFALGRRRLRVALAAFGAVHLHLLCDLAGSRGSDPGDLWPIHYLEPLAREPVVAWALQWPLVGWQNLAITAALMFATMRRAARTGYSPVVLASGRADAVFVGVLRKWRRQLTRGD